MPRPQSSCSLCGTKNRNLAVAWTLNLRICPTCLRGNLISNTVLRNTYGITLTTQIHPRAKGTLSRCVSWRTPVLPNKTTFIDLCFSNVFYFILHVSSPL